MGLGKTDPHTRPPSYQVEMAIQPISLWSTVAARKSTAMVANVGFSPIVSCASVGLEIQAISAKILNRCSEKQNWAGRRGASKARRELETVVRARRNGGRSPRSPLPSTSHDPLKLYESSRNSSPFPRKKTHKQEGDDGEGNEFDEEALEALFAQLEMDLEAGGVSDDEDFTEEEVIELENELAAALRDIEENEEEKLRTIDVEAGDAETSPEVDALNRDSKSSRRNKKKSRVQNTGIEMKDEVADATLAEFEDDEHEHRVVMLEPWQLRKLAAAVQVGRRKVNIKAFSAEVGMDRFDVLTWLKNPPPELLMYGITMNNEEISPELALRDGASNSSPANLNPAGKQTVGSDPDDRQNWHSQKRLRKEHEATFDRVFRSTDRPSNALLQNLVELTHVPRKRIVEWFEERRKAARVSPKFEALR